MLKKQRTTLYIITLLLSINLLIGFMLKQNLDASSHRAESQEKIEVFLEAYKLIQERYVKLPNAGDAEKRLYNAIAGMTDSLDRFSYFLPPKDMVTMDEMTSGEFGGIGIEIDMSGELPLITYAAKKNPAYQSGLRSGDLICQIDEQVITTKNMLENISMLKGKPGDSVIISVLRGEKRDRQSFTVIRAIIEIESVRNLKVIDKKTGYFQIISFNIKTPKQVHDALVELKSKKITQLIIDLRDNPGGLLMSSVMVCSNFLPKDSLVVTTEGRTKSFNFIHRTHDKPILAQMPIIILCNGDSASAAEIMIGCLKDSKRAVIVGEKSFGKGSVQELRKLSDGSALRLTVAHYYTPGHQVIHEKGIKPHITVPLTKEEHLQFNKTRHKLMVNDSKDFSYDKQLSKAIECFKEYKVIIQNMEVSHD